MPRLLVLMLCPMGLKLRHYNAEDFGSDAVDIGSIARAFVPIPQCYSAEAFDFYVVAHGSNTETFGFNTEAFNSNAQVVGSSHEAFGSNGEV